MKNIRKITAVFLVAMLLMGVSSAEPSQCPYDIHLSILYNYLSDAERTLFDRLYDALRKGESSVPVPDGVSLDRALWMMDFIYNEAPELCAYDRWNSCLSNFSDGMEIRLEYKLSIAEQEQFIREVAETAALFSRVSASKGLRALHDILCQNIDYESVLGEDLRLAYYALKNKRADCNGYAQSFVMLSHFSGFACSYIDGSATDDHGFPMGRHAWNIACADGKYFWLDVTWDDMGTSEPSVKWYGLDGATMSKTHFPDREYQPILDLKTVLPDKVTFTMHLDVNNQNGFNLGITQESGKKVQLKNLSAGEYYTPALVIWNDGYTPVKVDISYNLDGRFYRWSQAEVKANSNVVFRTNASQLKNKTGSHRIVWYCDGIPLGFFEWQVE